MTQEAEELQKRLKTQISEILRILSTEDLMVLLFEKISERHSLRENPDCPLCNSYYNLLKTLKL
jgi:hypothetical protein